MPYRRWLAPALGLVVAALTVFLVPDVLTRKELTLVVIIGQLSLPVMGLVLLHGLGRQLSLGQAGFMAIGAYSSAVLATQYRLPALLALVVGAVASAVIAAIIGYPLLRLRGLYFAVATLGLGTIISNLAVGAHGVTGGPSGKNVAPFSIAGFTLTTLRSQYWLMLIVVTLAYVVLRNLIRSPLGRAVRAIGRDELGAATMSVPVARYKVYVFVISAVLASVGGSLYAHTLNFISTDQVGPALSLQLVVMHFLGGATSLAGAIVGTAIMQIIPHVAPITRSYDLLIAGIILLVVLRLFPTGLIPGASQALARLRHRKPTGPDADPETRIPATATTGEGERRGADRESGPDREPKPVSTASAASAASAGDGHRPLLEVTGVQKFYSGIHVLDGVHCTARRGRITALIGPNGAGKTTLLNVMTGVVVPEEGSIRLGCEELTAMTPHETAARGIARTFQTPRLDSEATSLENVLMGTFALTRSTPLGAVLRTPGFRTDERALRERALLALRAVGLGHAADVPAGSLPVGSQRLLEIARAMATGPELLVLDEPAAGSNDAERLFLARTLSSFRAAGASILLVEHNMDLVMEVSDYIYVIDQGVPIGEGAPAEVQSNKSVIDAYLGGA